MENEKKEISKRFDLPFEKLRAILFKEIVVFMFLGHFVRIGIDGTNRVFEKSAVYGLWYLIIYWVFIWLISLIRNKLNKSKGS
tara:strand:- start:840 stop:1088 length:249 start_codon:yes stop_codon:yes gene_type:complete